VRTLLGAVLALACLGGVAAGVGLAVPRGASPFALSAAATPHAQQAPRVEHRATDAIRTTGCGKAPEALPGASAQETLRLGALTRHYRLHVPAAYEEQTLTPLVLSFHGHGGTAAQNELLTGLSPLADLHRFIAVYPQGVVGPDGATGWNTGRRQDPAVDDLLYVDTLLTHLQESLCVDPQRIYATGFSNGGGMTAILACVFADRIAAFAPVAGDFYPQVGGCHPARPAPIVELHGTLDAINPYEGSLRLDYPPVGTWLSDWAQRDGCGAAPVFTRMNADVTAEQWSDCRDGAAVLHYRLTGIGHIWPSRATPASLAGGSNALDATTAIWTFFTRFSLAAPGSESAI
jgi:polyhydroxybutyrate depolymerase